MLHISIRSGSLLDTEAEAIVCPANSRGKMGGGAAKAIKNAAGDEIEEEAMRQAPVPIGAAIVTNAGQTSYKAIIHAPVREEPAEEIVVSHQIAQATRAALKKADKEGFSVIAMPGMGTGVGGVPVKVAAALMLKEIYNFSATKLKKIILIDINEEMVNAWINEKDKLKK